MNLQVAPVPGTGAIEFLNWFIHSYMPPERCCLKTVYKARDIYSPGFSTMLRKE